MSVWSWISLGEPLEHSFPHAHIAWVICTTWTVLQSWRDSALNERQLFPIWNIRSDLRVINPDIVEFIHLSDCQYNVGLRITSFLELSDMNPGNASAKKCRSLNGHW